MFLKFLLKATRLGVSIKKKKKKLILSIEFVESIFVFKK
jgi:hypothetical protein